MLWGKYTKEMLFTGRLLTSADALQDGFITAIVDEEQLTAHVAEVAQRIVVAAPLTIWAARGGAATFERC